MARTPLEALDGVITPSGLHYVSCQNGVPQIDPAEHRLDIDGLVENPIEVTVERLLRYPMTTQTLVIESGDNSSAGWQHEPMQGSVGACHGLVSCSEWTGVPLSILLGQAGVMKRAAWAVAEGADASPLNASTPISKLLDDAFLAFYQNGERIRPENGYPMRLIVPGWEGATHVKWLRRLHVTDQPGISREETAKKSNPSPAAKARQFTLVMDAKSLITSPSPGLRMFGPDVYEIRGLAWSGRGRIAKVEVSADAGASWTVAALQEPILPRCFTRFRAPWKWDGAPSVLKSRATDETGYVQPERDVLLKRRGSEGYVHYNAIVAWRVDCDGAITHVYA